MVCIVLFTIRVVNLILCACCIGDMLFDAVQFYITTCCDGLTACPSTQMSSLSQSLAPSFRSHFAFGVACFASPVCVLSVAAGCLAVGAAAAIPCESGRAEGDAHGVTASHFGSAGWAPEAAGATSRWAAAVGAPADRARGGSYRAATAWPPPLGAQLTYQMVSSSSSSSSSTTTSSSSLLLLSLHVVRTLRVRV